MEETLVSRTLRSSSWEPTPLPGKFMVISAAIVTSPEEALSCSDSTLWSISGNRIYRLGFLNFGAGGTSASAPGFAITSIFPWEVAAQGNDAHTLICLLLCCWEDC